jgi:RNA polymerase sigma-70 factor (ECF subfamily)
MRRFGAKGLAVGEKFRDLFRPLPIEDAAGGANVTQFARCFWKFVFRAGILAGLVTFAVQKASSMVGQKDSGSDSTEPRRTRALPGDRATLWEITGGWRPYLKAVAADVLGGQVVGKVDPSDIVQAALVAAMQGVSGFRGKTVQDWQAWIVAIVRNEARQVQRHWHRDRRDVECEQALALGSKAEQPLAGSDSSPSQLAMRRERASQLMLAISQLDADDRQIIELRHFGGLSHEEAAAQMERTPAAARKLWGRALARLRAKLEDDNSSVLDKPLSSS